MGNIHVAKPRVIPRNQCYAEMFKPCLVIADVYFTAKEFVLNNYRLTYVAALATLNFW